MTITLVPIRAAIAAGTAIVYGLALWRGAVAAAAGAAYLAGRKGHTA